MKRGEICWAELRAPAGRRPVLLLSRQAAYRIRRSVTVAPVTTRIRNIPVEVKLGLEDGMPRACVVNVDDITTIRSRLLLQRITELSEAKMREVARAIKFALDLD